jgi:endonuclease/exonuclease/phosphatase family metal-dependent hydrolase
LPPKLRVVVTIRVMTYNTHACVGLDRRLDPERVARVIEEAKPDIVALQELDAGRNRSGGADQPVWLAERLGMQLDFCSARSCDGGHYGNAVLSRYPLNRVRQACLPRIGTHSEARAVQWVTADTPAGPLDIFNTHLALRAKERLAQAEELIGQSWLSDPRCRSHSVLCGDFNALPGSGVVRRLCATLRDAGLVAAPGMQRTFPSLLPLMRLDYVFVGRGVHVGGCSVPRTSLTRMASDHLPLIVDLDLTDGSRSKEHS